MLGASCGLKGPGSQATSPRWHQIQNDADSARLQISSIADERARPCRPIELRKKLNEEIGKPRQPTSTAKKSIFQPLSLHSWTRCSYFLHFFPCASRMHRSKGTVSSAMIIRLILSDQMTISGRKELNKVKAV